MSASSIPDAAWSFYGYSPSYSTPIAFSALFGVTFIAHLYLMISRRAYYMIPFVIGVGGEVAAYGVRRVSAAHPVGRSVGLLPYIIQSLFVILAPALMAATHYMIFGRLISFVGERFSPVRASRVTAIFVIFDVLSFIIQGGGGSLYSSSNVGLYKVAKTVLIVGFLVQVLSFGVFGVGAIIYQIRARRAGEPAGPWTSCLYTLYAGCVLILIRGIFRVVEFGSGSGGQTGYLLTHEAWYYALEAAPILLCSILFIVSHPSRYIPSDRTVRLHPEELPTTAPSPHLSSESTSITSEKFASLEGTEKRRWWQRRATSA